MQSERSPSYCELHTCMPSIPNLCMLACYLIFTTQNIRILNILYTQENSLGRSCKIETLKCLRKAADPRRAVYPFRNSLQKCLLSLVAFIILLFPLSL